MWAYTQARGRQRKLIELETGAYLGIDVDRNGGFSIFAYYTEDRKVLLAHYAEEMEARDVLDQIAIRVQALNMQTPHVPIANEQNIHAQGA
jgi:hypothetical protein